MSVEDFGITTLGGGDRELPVMSTSPSGGWLPPVVESLTAFYDGGYFSDFVASSIRRVAITRLLFRLAGRGSTLKES